MEGVPRISMMSFPLRKSADAPSFKAKLKAYIRDEYKEDGESYNNEIHELESLRAGAIHISKDFSGCSTLKKYFCQLNFLRTRFPMMEGGPCAITFSWYDVFSETVHGWADVEFEMSCVLYNIGALHSELGATDNRQTADGMKNACTHFQCAAWAFQQMRHNYQNFFTQDISPDTLSIMTNICLAQAQECILEKSLIDNRKSTITAKVALQIVEYYQLALKTCDQMIKDAGQYSDKGIKAVKKWKKLIELKSHYYGSISLLYRGLQAEDESKYGERVTFYKSALEKLTEAAKCAKSLDKTDNVHDTIQFTFDVVQGKVAISERENEFVYHEKVPELSAITTEIKGVSLVKGIPFKFDDPQIAGPDIFGRLVPIEAHEVSSLYSEEKAKILRHYSSKIEGKNEALDKTIIALQLAQIDLQSSMKKIPQELVDCCAALSVNKDTVKRLSELMAKLSGMFHDVEGNLGEIEDILKEEEVKEKEYHEIMGTKRHPSNVVLEMNREVQKYRSAHGVAAETNQTLHEALSKHVGNLQILMKPFEEVVKHIPAFEEDDQADQEAIAQMKKLIGKVDEMRKQRISLENQLRESIHSDDITNKIVIKVESDLMELFREELKKHDKITQILDQNLLAQDNIIRALTEANANYAETRKKTVQVMKRRDKVIEDLLSSYESYDELLNKCNKGIEFYTKLDTNVQKLLQRVRAVCKVQEEERETSMKTLINKTKAMNFNNMSSMPPGAPNLGMNVGYIPRTGSGGPFQDTFSMPSTPPMSIACPASGHLKLKDVLAMKKQPQPQQQPQPQPISNVPFSQTQNQPQQQTHPQTSYATASDMPYSQIQNQPPRTSYTYANVPFSQIQTQPPQQAQPQTSYTPATNLPYPQIQNQPQQISYLPSTNMPYSQMQNQPHPQAQPQSSYTPAANLRFPQIQTQPQQQPQQTSYSPATNMPYSQLQNQPHQSCTPSSSSNIPFSQMQGQPLPSNIPVTNSPFSQSQTRTQNQQFYEPQPHNPWHAYDPGQHHPYTQPTSQQPQQPPSQAPPQQQPTPQAQPIPQQQPLSQPLPQQQQPASQFATQQEYNPNDSYLAKYVKQYLGPTNASSNKTSNSTNNPSTNFLGLNSQQFQQQNQNPSSDYQHPQPLTSGQYGNGYQQNGQGQPQYQYQNSNSNGGINNQAQMPQHQSYYNNPNQAQPPAPQQHQAYYGQPQGQYNYPQQQHAPQNHSSNIDLLSDIDLNSPSTQPLIPAVVPNGNPEHQG